MRLGTNALRAALVATGLLGAAACGSGDGGGDDFADRSASDIKDAAIKDMKTVTSLTMDGTIKENGQELSLTLSSDTDGKCAGEISQGGGTARFIGGEETYLKGDEAFWTNSVGGAQQAQQILALVGDKWAKVPASAGASFESFCDLDNLLDDFTKEDDSTVKKGDTGAVDGEDAVVIEGTSDSGDPTKAWIAVDGKHHILKLQGEGDTSGSFTFSDYDEPVEADAPPSDEVVDLSQQG
ncbi:hypothetical protein EKO23_01570 [Nocardioides guangzhouensis]|uniref:Lipoprotein n=1 Tax=Nocardioides guangzhouensis TaxID=2497878 RepID=A0A4Q4ZL04_9ACTN|nr:hypothetical protein [Nocardioides guangzhouensis]RYP88605.1 hypothetical protein EKO23_01570 [Nocardioides guangzhouensis]